MARKSRSRPLSPEERQLWAAVQKTIRPLSPIVLNRPISLENDHAPRHQGHGQAQGKAAPVKGSTPHHPPRAVTERHQVIRHALVDGGDPGRAKRVGRGHDPIDATLDLHGLTQEEAERRLQHFITMARASGFRRLLIITGKGSSGKSEPDAFGAAPRGILRRRFLEWIEAAPLANQVAQVQQAHQRHGGRGAFYVFLKRLPGPSKAR